MKIKFLLPLLIITIPTLCVSQTKTIEQRSKVLIIQHLDYLLSNTYLEHLVGKVKTVQINVYLADFSFGEITKKDLFDRSTKTYDEQGYLIHETRYIINNGSATINSEVNYLYDDKHNLKSITATSPNGTLINKTIFRYDDKSNITEKASYLATGDFDFDGKRIYIYDNNGNMIEEKIYDPAGKFTGSRSLKYNEFGLLTSDETTSDGYSDKAKFKYDALGNKVEEVDYHNGMFGVKIIFKYDENGHLLSEKHYNENGGLSAMSPQSYHKYDKAGNEIELINTSTSDNSINDKTRNEYNYDEKLNWIKCISFSQYLTELEKPDRIIERVISYYQ